MEIYTGERETYSIEELASRLKSTFLLGIGIVTFILTVGTCGYMIIEDMGFFDALYMTVITVSTVGFQEIKPLSTAGRVFTMFVVMSGTASFFYFMGLLLSVVSEGGIFVLIDHARRMRKMKNMRDHIIVCGYGRVGESVCEELVVEGVPFVVIEKNINRVKILMKKKFTYVHGVAGEETLKTAGIERARSLILALGDDVDNLFVALTARELNPNLFIVSRLNNPVNEDKFLRIGVDRIVMPYKVGATRMAQSAIRPAVTSLIDVITTKKGLDIFIEEIKVEGPFLVGKSLIELDLRRKYGLIVVGILREAVGFIQAEPDIRLQTDDIMIVIGSKASISRFLDDIKVLS